MKRENIKAIVFDLDGTLIRSTIDFGKMKRRIIKALVAYGVKRNVFSNDWKTTRIMVSGEKFLRKTGLDEDCISEILDKVSEIMNKVELEKVSKTKQINGVIKTLLELRKRGLKIAVLTRGCREYALEALRVVGMLELIDSLLARDDTDRPKPDPNQLLKIIETLRVKAEETIMVGDSLLDALCAENAGIKFIGVLTGIATEEELRKIGSSARAITVLSDITGITNLLYPNNHHP